jgi:hypothetical protein
MASAGWVSLALCFVLVMGLGGIVLPPDGFAEAPRADVAKVYDEAQAAEQARQFNRAIEGYREVVKRWPGSPKAPQAQLHVAHILACTGRPEQALLEYQQVRTLFASSPEAAAALEQMSTYYRWERTRIGVTPAGAPDPAPFVAKSLGTNLPDVFEDPRSAFVNSSGQLMVFDKHRKRVFRFSLNGDLIEAISFSSPQVMARTEIGTASETFVADGESIRTLGKPESFGLPNPQKRSESGLKNITALGLSASGDLWTTSSDLPGALKYSVERKTGETTAVALVPKNVRAIEFDFYGNVYFLDTKQSRIVAISPSGETRATISPDSGNVRLSAITDFYIDPFNQLFLLDAEDRVIAVFAIRADWDQKIELLPLTRVAWGQLSPGPEFRSVRTFAVAGTGEMFLVAHKSGRILKVF